MSIRVGFYKLENTIKKSLINSGLNEDIAALFARIQTE